MIGPSRWLQELGALVYPPACRLCGAAVDEVDGGQVACELHRLPHGPEGPRCGRCCAGLPDFLPDGRRCAGCRLHPPGWDRAVCLADYREDQATREWLMALKHGGRRELGRVLGAALGAAWMDRGPRFAPDALLCPIPLHPLRRWERGYNQAWGLALGLSAATGLRCVDLLERKRVTAPQGALASPPRKANVAGAFRAVDFRSRRFVGREVWLVDDVSTSGATASVAARELRRAGLGPVGLAVVGVARGSTTRQDERP